MALLFPRILLDFTLDKCLTVAKLHDRHLKYLKQRPLATAVPFFICPTFFLHFRKPEPHCLLHILHRTRQSIYVVEYTLLIHSA